MKHGVSHVGNKEKQEKIQVPSGIERLRFIFSHDEIILLI